MAIKKAEAVEVNIDAIVSNLVNGKATKAEDLLTLFRWSESQRLAKVSEANILERFADYCEQLKAADGSFLPYNKNLPFVARCVVAWADKQEGAPSWDDVKTVQATVGRAIWQTRYENVSRQKALPVYRAGGDAETIKETITEMCPERTFTWEDVVKAVMGKHALPLALDLVNNGVPLDLPAESKLESKRDDALSIMAMILEQHGATVTWGQAPITTP